MTVSDIGTWLAIAFCLSQSAMFSGLNLAFFSVGRLRLEAEAEQGNEAAQKILSLRKDANFLLCSILWGNVCVNVLIALLSKSVMAGVGAFFVSTMAITFFGEIVPQAYFSRNAIRVGALLSPVIRAYQVLLFPVAKPSALILDGWVGPEGPNFMRERDIEIILQKHIREEDSEIGAAEGRGALNFLDLDDRLVSREGSAIDPETVHAYPLHLDLPVLPRPEEPAGAAFVERLKRAPDKWAVITDEGGEPRIVLDTNRYLFDIANRAEDMDIYRFCHRPVVIKEAEATLGDVLGEFVVEADDKDDRIVDRDVILFWLGDQRRIITGADIFGRLLQGIARRESDSPAGDRTTEK